MSYNKVILPNGNVAIDLTQDSVTEETLLEGETAHNKKGEQITGKATLGGALPKVTIEDDGKILEVVNGEWQITNTLINLIKDVNSLLGKRSIYISSFSIEPSVVVLGKTVDTVNFAWAWGTSDTPKRVILSGGSLGAGMEIDTSLKSYQLLGQEIKTDTKFTLRIEDAEMNSDSKSASITFLNYIYYGTTASITNKSDINSDIIRSLQNQKLANYKVGSISGYATDGEYILYALPTRLGTCNFTDTETNLLTDFEEIEITVTNSAGYSETYFVYKSIYSSLGDFSYSVS